MNQIINYCHIGIHLTYMCNIVLSTTWYSSKWLISCIHFLPWIMWPHLMVKFYSFLWGILWVFQVWGELSSHGNYMWGFTFGPNTIMTIQLFYYKYTIVHGKCIHSCNSSCLDMMNKPVVCNVQFVVHSMAPYGPLMTSFCRNCVRWC